MSLLILKTHVWKPLLHEVATGALNVGEDEVNYFTHASQFGYRFHYGWMNGLDTKRKIIKTAPITDLEGNEVSGPREFAYDKLVMAVGGQTNSFGIPGVYENCFRLDCVKEAERLRRRFLGLNYMPANWYLYLCRHTYGKNVKSFILFIFNAQVKH